MAAAAQAAVRVGGAWAADTVTVAWRVGHGAVDLGQAGKVDQGHAAPVVHLAQVMVATLVAAMAALEGGNAAEVVVAQTDVASAGVARTAGLEEEATVVVDREVCARLRSLRRGNCDLSCSTC